MIQIPLETATVSNQMREYPRILVITSCTGEKRFKPENQLKLEDFKDPVRLQAREAELAEFATPAAQICPDYPITASQNK